MSNLLQNKTAILTGCNRGIGKSILEIFAENGCVVYENQQLINMKSIKDIFTDTMKTWKDYVRELSDDELMQDRSEWMKTYGRDIENDIISQKDRFLYHQELYTIAIEIEQLNRWGLIYYKKDKKKSIV